jgi:hypothetical protein
VKFKSAAASVIVLGTIAFIDYKASNELVFDQFFLIPVAIAAWFGGRRAAWSMAAAASAAWIAVNYFVGHRYLHEYNRYWNSALVLIRLLIAGTVIAVFRKALVSAKKNLAEKEAALEALQKSTAEIRSYEGRFQTICAWTNQIKDGDEWITFPKFLTRHLNTRVTHGISPEAAAMLNSGFKTDSTPLLPPSPVSE